jgi:sterol desaturase/sphingolipid hydroxylase (fatty acid hydroxylase superfamily)
MIVEWAQQYLKAFGSAANVVWFVGFWLFVAFLLSLETWIPAFQRRPERSFRWPTNFGLGAINAGLIAATPVSTISAAVWANRAEIGLLNQFAMPLWISTCSTVVVYSLAVYLTHVIEHKISWLWRVHRVHHLDTHIDVSTSQRHHPLESVISVLTLVAVTVVFGLTPPVVIVYEGIEATASFLTHANVRLPESWDRIARWVFVTPNMHSLHHSSHPAETDSNYGSVFTLWDRIFGTYRAAPTSGYEMLQIGLQEIRDDRASNFWWQIKSPALQLKDSSADTRTLAAAIRTAD